MINTPMGNLPEDDATSTLMPSPDSTMSPAKETQKTVASKLKLETVGESVQD